MALKHYRELKVWQKSYQFCLGIYTATRGFPSDERYGLTAQIRRSAVSVPSNIAEGYGRKTAGEYLHSLYVAYGSICELETQLLLAVDLGYVKEEDPQTLRENIEEIERMLKALINALERKRSSP